jgi:hypothetical protein
MLSGINWLAVVVAAVVGFGVGAVWFGPLFGKAWMKALDKKPEELGSPAKAMGLTAVTTLVTAAALAYLFDVLGVGSWVGGSIGGISVGAFFVGTSIYSDGLFMGTPNKLAMINIGHRIVYFAVMGAVLGAWPS